MKFKELKIGDLFVFKSEVLICFSGMMKGPWEKISDRKYKHIGNGMEYIVGSINVEVIID